MLAHELTHLFTLDAATELGRGLRRVFGTLPILYSTAQMPPWALEGLAVYGESRFSGDGRLDHAPYRLMLAAARRDGLFPGWSRIDGLPAAWPGPTAKYLFGAGFMEFLAEKYGADRLRLYLDRVAARLVLISSSRDFQNTFGEPLGDLWDEYRDLAPRVEGGAAGPAPAPLTREGFSHQYPCPLGKDGLVFFSRDYRRRGAIESLDLPSGRERTLLKMDAVNGISFAAKENKVYFSAVDLFHAFSEFSDLYAYDVKSGRRQRLSRGQRLSQPVKRENSSEIFCVQRGDGGYRLAVFDMKQGTARPLSRLFAGVGPARTSPRTAAWSRRRSNLMGDPGGSACFRSTAKRTRSSPRPGPTSASPAGKATGNCSSSRPVRRPRSWLRSPSTAAAAFAGTRACRACGNSRFQGTEVSYSSPASAAAARRSRASSLDGLSFSPQELIVASAIPGADAAPPLPAARPYRPWRDLLPRWWSPALRPGGDELQAGIMTGGQDALGIHNYSLEGYYGFSSRRANFLFNYVYDGLFPTLSLSYHDETDDHGYFLRTRELKLASLWPLRLRKRSQLYAYVDLHAEWLSQISDHGHYAYRGSTNGFRLGLEFNSAREYYDSISPSDGVRLTLQCSIHPAGLGNKWTSRERPGRPAPLHSSLPARGAGLAPGAGQKLGS